MLKDASKQSGASWDVNRCMIVVDPPIWANITTKIYLQQFLPFTI